MSKIFGIDLGTTYSCIAYVDEYGKATVVTNEDNKPVTPSVVYFETADNIPVGDVAKAKLETDPELVCSTVKRQMGNRDWFFEAHGKQFNAEMVSEPGVQRRQKLWRRHHHRHHSLQADSLAHIAEGPEIHEEYAETSAKDGQTEGEIQE